MVERLMLLASSNEVDAATVHSVLAPSAEGSSVSLGSGTLSDRVENFEHEVILAELKRSEFSHDKGREEL